MSHLCSNDEERISNNQPDFLKSACKMLYGEYQPEQELKQFVAHWGRLDQETFLRVLAEGQGEDRMLAICFIGESDLPQVPILLLPLLQSVQTKERWLSALYLGQRKEKLALPILVAMLTEFLPSEESPTPAIDLAWFDEYRGRAVSTLLLWKDASLIPAFRHALVMCVEAERYLPDHPVQKHIVLQRWYAYQDGLSYALGSLGAFGALMGISISQLRQRIAILKMVSGYKQLKAHLVGNELIVGWEQEGELRTSVKAVLEQRFGLTEKEQENYLNSYKRDLHTREKNLSDDQ